MSTTTVILYVGTVVIVFLSVVFIILVSWATYTINKFKKFSKNRDEHYIERIEGLEALIRTEFKSVLESLKDKL